MHSFVWADICHIVCVTAYLRGCMQRKGDKSRTMECVSACGVETTQEGINYLKHVSLTHSKDIKHKSRSAKAGADTRGVSHPRVSFLAQNRPDTN